MCEMPYALLVAALSTAMAARSFTASPRLDAMVDDEESGKSRREST